VGRLPSAVAAPARVPFTGPDGARLLLAVPLFDGRTLVGLAGLVIRPLRLDTDSHQSILVAVGADAAFSQGAVRRPDGSAPADLARKAVQALGSRRVTSFTGQVDSRAPVRGTDTAPVATAAKVGSLDVSVVSVIDTPTSGAASRWDGVPPAAALVLLGVGVFLFIRFALVRPVLRLLDHAKAVACGEPGRLSRPPYLAELRRIGRVLEGPRIPAQRRVGRAARRRGGIPAAFAVVVAALAIATWSGAVMVVFSSPTVNLPSQLAADAQNQVEAAAASFRSVFEGGWPN
jgi:hypothetical protein